MNWRCGRRVRQRSTDSRIPSGVGNGCTWITSGRPTPARTWTFSSGPADPGSVASPTDAYLRVTVPPYESVVAFTVAAPYFGDAHTPNVSPAHGGLDRSRGHRYGLVVPGGRERHGAASGRLQGNRARRRAHDGKPEF